ncbi:hypothetical protein SAMN06296378_2492 [Salinibacterium xinjiangense]|uniref:Uncharacterized protein n=1 Tax=Salinibacterium xinjiangense TaxID=386302 RepID=A0A2C9A0L7_9MICO|nr:hypothetical protein SAMN06296378_2492 [Salinibacterium xinjiangense]
MEGSSVGLALMPTVIPGTLNGGARPNAESYTHGGFPAAAFPASWRGWSPQDPRFAVVRPDLEFAPLTAAKHLEGDCVVVERE